MVASAPLCEFTCLSPTAHTSSEVKNSFVFVLFFQLRLLLYYVIDIFVILVCNIGAACQ